MDCKFRLESIKKIKNMSPGCGKRLLWIAEQYIEECLYGEWDEDGECDEIIIEKAGRHGRRSRKNNDKKRFPNIAGLCRYIGISARKYAELTSLYPEETGQILAAFEDEALNAEKAAAILVPYLKARLGYSGHQTHENDGSSGEVKIIFEHDIFADGE